MKPLHKENQEEIGAEKKENRTKQVSGMVTPSFYKKDFLRVKQQKDPHLTDSALVYKLLHDYVNSE